MKLDDCKKKVFVRLRKDCGFNKTGNYGFCTINKNSMDAMQPCCEVLCPLGLKVFEEKEDTENGIIIYIPISQKNRLKKEAQQHHISLMIGSGWTHEGIIRLTDSLGTEAEFVVLKFVRKGDRNDWRPVKTWDREKWKKGEYDDGK